MKKIITSAIAILAFSISFAQEKGDNFIGLNFSSGNYEFKDNSSFNNQKNTGVGLNYSHFVRTNRRLGVNFGVFNSNLESSSNNQKSNGFNLNLNYGILFPILKNFYAEAAPNIGFNRFKGKNDNNQNTNFDEVTGTSYSLGATGGLLWIPFKHFGLSTNLLSLSFGYGKSKSTNTFNNSTSESKSTTININNTGGLQNQSFTVFYKF
jgi:hypothetical protein